MDQLEIHKKIDEFFKAGVEAANIDYGKKLMDHNPDSKKYFFAKADENWLDWLLNNGFLDKIKEKADDPTKFFYRLAELDYLTGMAEKKPAEVANIILSVPISKETFNPEIIDRFLWIIGDMPAEQIKILSGKIREDEWVYLMRKFNKSAFEFNKMVKKLAEAKEYNALLDIARAMLLIKTNEEAEEARKKFSDAEFFYLNYINEVGLFGTLANIDDSHSEEALKLLAEVLGKIIKQKGKSKNDVFEYEDFFALYDADIFTVDFKQGRSMLREDFESLVISIKKLIEKISKEHPEKETAEKLLKIINDLPENHLVWRLRLFVLSRYPQIFKNEIKNVFFKAFEVGERYFEITGGAEYHQLLVQCFGVLDPEIEQREYVKKVFDYFNAKLDDKDKEKWRRRDGGKILCFIKNSLKPEEKKEAKDKFDISPDEAECVPTPISSGIRGGSVNNLSPVKLADFTVEQIITKLKIEWTPEKLKEKFKGDDFLSPRGSEGLGDALKEDIKKRADEYLKKINFFFDREKIHSHYLYSILRGTEEALRDKSQLNLEQIDQILGLFGIIKDEGRKNAFEKKKRDHGVWLADWIEVHRVITDVLLFIVESKAIREGAHKEYRKKIIDIIEYLLIDVKASPSKEDEKPEYGEPFNVAINSVRGRAYQVFTAFIQNDGEKLAFETKEIFKKVLADNTMSVRFVVGHYLAAFYFRDKDFITGLFPKIFPKDELAKKDLYLAAWEGYLVNTLYDKLFVDLKEYYLYAITLKPEEYTKRKYTKDLDEALAVHLALAFVHLGLKRSDDLFEQFWKEPNIKRHQEFISFVGRDCLSRNQVSDEWLKENKVDKDKLIEFWTWAIENAEPEALSGFGSWINQEKGVLDDKIVAEKMAETLIKSGGDIEWDYALMKRLPVLAEKNADKTLEIIENYLLDSDKKLNQNREAPLLYRDDIKRAMKIIYDNGSGEIKQKATDLINTLIEKGSSMFWGLKEVINENLKSV
ncbi:MAG: hypothetical protein Q7K54_04470 [Candidatus Parcubacteria bacterium]|nr:hypothetical protein [Candidatus Parcubacteria bacterium]